MWHRLFGLVIAGGIVLGHASAANAQFSLSIGNPYAGGVSIGQPFGYGYGGYPYGGYANNSYSSYYGAYGVPLGGLTTYSSGYSGIVAPAVPYYGTGYLGTPVYGYANRRYAPYYGYGVYGMGPRAYGRFGRRGWGW